MNNRLDVDLVKKVVTLQINIGAESGIQEKIFLMKKLVTHQMKKLVTHQINIEAESRIGKKGFLWIIPSKDGNNVFILQIHFAAESGIQLNRLR